MSSPVDPAIPVDPVIPAPDVPAPPAGPPGIVTVTISPYTPDGGTEQWRFALSSAVFGEGGGDEFATQAEAQAGAEAFARTLHHKAGIPPDPRTLTYTFDPTTQGPPA